MGALSNSGTIRHQKSCSATLSTSCAGTSKSSNDIEHSDQVVAPSQKLSRKKQVLLLQGPVGPFFRELHRSLSAAGFSVKHVVFNSGDSLFSFNQDRVRFTGTLDAWEAWLRFEIAQNQPDFIVLFGSSRPAHKVARKIAKIFGIYVLSLEEGYLRAGYVTALVLQNYYPSKAHHRSAAQKQL